jgi:integrase
LGWFARAASARTDREVPRHAIDENRSNLPTDLDKLVRWKETVDRLGLGDVRFHDLRHTGNTLAARSGVSTRDLMARMGHDSMQAAIIYQHATTEADARIAAALDLELASDDGTRSTLTTDDRSIDLSGGGDGLG